MDPDQRTARPDDRRLHDLSAKLLAHEKELQRLAYQGTENRHDAEELVQDVFLIALRNLDEVLIHPNIEAWLKDVLRNQIASHYRKLSKPAIVPSEEKPTLPFKPRTVEWILDVLGQEPPNYLAKTIAVFMQYDWDRKKTQTRLGYDKGKFRDTLATLHGPYSPELANGRVSMARRFSCPKSTNHPVHEVKSTGNSSLELAGHQISPCNVARVSVSTLFTSDQDLEREGGENILRLLLIRLRLLVRVL